MPNFTDDNKLNLSVASATASYQQQHSSDSSSLNFKDKAKAFSKFVGFMRNSSKLCFGTATHSATGPMVTISSEGSLRELLMCSSNDYLNLATNEEVKKVISDAMEQYGVGMGSSRVGAGFSAVHQELENKLAKSYKKEAAILFPAGYDAISSTLKCLLSENDAAIVDRSCHASIFNGVKESGAQSRTFRHNDTTHLESILRSASKSKRFKTLMVVIEGAYSMDGDIAKLNQLVPICKKYNATIFIDEAHSIGLYGKTGLGVAEQYDYLTEIDFIAGTFSKSLGSVGGFVAANKNFIDYFNFFADKILFSATLPPMLIAGVSKAFTLVSDGELKKQFWKNLNYLRGKLEELGVLVVQGEGPTIIVPIVSEEVAFDFAGELIDSGIFCLPYVYPAVPRGKAIFRISVQRLHSFSDLDNIANTFAKLNLHYSERSVA